MKLILGIILILSLVSLILSASVGDIEGAVPPIALHKREISAIPTIAEENVPDQLLEETIIREDDEPTMETEPELTENFEVEEVEAMTKTKTSVTSKQSNEDVCLTKGCVNAASAMIKKMDPTINPCDDFFEFSCGAFVKNNHIPDEKSGLTTFSIVNDELTEKLRTVVGEPIKSNDSIPTKMVKNLYASCMDTDAIATAGLQPLKDILARMGGWPVVEGSSWNASIFNWIDALYTNRKEGFSVDYFFDFSVTTDIKNSTKRIIWLDQTALGLSREYLIKGKQDKDVQAYLEYSIDVATLLGADPAAAKKEMEEVLDFQIALAEISMPREERRNMTRLYNLYTLKDLSSKIPEIPFVKYINTVLVPSVQVTENEIVGVSNITFFHNLTKLLDVTPSRTLANYLMWRVSGAAASYLSEDIRDIQLEFSRKITGKTTRPPRWKECMAVVSGKLSYAVSNLYVTNFFDEEAKSQALDLVTYIRKEFNKILNNLDWMDPETKIQAKAKADAIKSQIAYPPEVKMVDKLMEYYGDLKVDNKSLLNNMIRITIFGTNYSFGRLRKPVDKNDWKRQGAVAVVNAYYSSIENSIKFPAGILQGVFFEPDRPKYMNFAGIGYVIGHEITHGFDDQGKQFDAVGNLRNWWKSPTEQHFLKKAQCIIHQYGNYSAPENGMMLNGINTQGENIADNGGIKEAYGAYQAWAAENPKEKILPGLMEYSRNQLFWISAAQVWCSKYRPEALKVRILTGVHSPGRFRILGPFSNAPEFAKDWNCPVNSTMNPSKKCTVW